MIYTKYFSSDLSNNPGQHESKAVGTKGYVRALRSEAEIRWMELNLVLRKQRNAALSPRALQLGRSSQNSLQNRTWPSGNLQKNWAKPSRSLPFFYMHLMYLFS